MFNSYFSSIPIREKGAIINLVLSDRSDGKTFDSKYMILKDWKDKHKASVYLRRYKSEITPITYSFFFDDVINKEKGKEFKEWKFKGNKHGVLVKTKENDKWEYIVYFVILSCSGKQKSSIPNETSIDMIYYDEFVPLDNRYLKDEIGILIEFYKTIDRDRDKVQLIILGNKLTPFNPFFDYFDIKMRIDSKNKIRLYKEGSIAVQIYSSKEHREYRKETKLSRAIKGTSYEEYDQGGILYSIGMQQANTDGKEYWCSFKTSKGEGSLWYGDNNEIVVSSKLRKDGYLISDKIYNVQREQYTVKFGSFARTIKTAYRSNMLYFESDKTFYDFEDIIYKSSAL